MAKQSTTEAPAKVTRKMPTAEERVAALELKLADAKAKAEAKANKGKTEAVAKRDALVERIAKLQAKVNELNEVIGEDSTDAVVEPAAEDSTDSTES